MGSPFGHIFQLRVIPVIVCHLFKHTENSLIVDLCCVLESRKLNKDAWMILCPVNYFWASFESITRYLMSSSSQLLWKTRSIAMTSMINGSTISVESFLFWLLTLVLREHCVLSLTTDQQSLILYNLSSEFLTCLPTFQTLISDIFHICSSNSTRFRLRPLYV